MNYTRGRYGGLILLISCWTLACAGAIYLIVPSGILPVVQRRLAIGPGAAGWIISIPYAAEALCAVPLGVLLDRMSGRRVLGGGVVLIIAASAMGAVTGESGRYGLFLVSRFLGGAAYMAIWLSSIRLVSSRFPDRTATALGILTTSGPAGLAFGLSLGPAIISGSPWHHVFWVILVLIIPTGLLAIVSARDTSAAHERDDPAVNPVRALRRALQTRGLLLVALMSFAAYSLFLLFSSWMPSYLADSYGFSLAKSSLLASVFPAIGVLARFSGGFVSDYLLDGGARQVLTVSFVVLTPVVSAIAVGTSAGILVVLLLASGFFVQTGIGLFFSYGPTFVTKSARGTAVAVINTAGLTGSFTAPIVAGTIVGVAGEFTTVFGYAIALVLLGLMSALLLPSGVVEAGG